MEKQLSLNLFSTGETKNKEKEIAQVINLPSTENIADGQIIIYRHFFEQSESEHFFTELLNNIDWRQDKIKIFGQEVNLPRLTAWYGNEGKSYTYSGITMNPAPWTQNLLSIKKRYDLNQEKDLIIYLPTFCSNFGQIIISI